MADPDLPDYRETDAVPMQHPDEVAPSRAAELRAQARELDEAHHAESTFHLSDESIARSGARAPSFRPVVDEKTGAHTGELVSSTPPAPEVHG